MLLLLLLHLHLLVHHELLLDALLHLHLHLLHHDRVLALVSHHHLLLGHHIWLLHLNRLLGHHSWLRLRLSWLGENVHRIGLSWLLDWLGLDGLRAGTHQVEEINLGRGLLLGSWLLLGSRLLLLATSYIAGGLMFFRDV